MKQIKVTFYLSADIGTLAEAEEILEEFDFNDAAEHQAYEVELEEVE